MKICRWMKKFERNLLDDLKGDSVKNVPLKEVRNALGAVANVVGNPLFKAEISIQVDTFFIDAAGPVQIAWPGLPIGLQTALPVYLLGLTDYYGGYAKSHQILPPQLGWFLSDTIGIFGSSSWIGGGFIPAPFYLANAQAGDLWLSFQDTPGAGLAFKALVRIRCNNVSYGTFLNSFVSDLITVNTIRMFVPAANILQLTNPLIFGVQSLFGKLSTDSIDPRMFQTPDDFQNQISDIPVNIPINKDLMLCFNINIDCVHEELIFFVNKVEPLTNRPTKIKKFRI